MCHVDPSHAPTRPARSPHSFAADVVDGAVGVPPDEEPYQAHDHEAQREPSPVTVDVDHHQERQQHTHHQEAEPEGGEEHLARQPDRVAVIVGAVRRSVRRPRAVTASWSAAAAEAMVRLAQNAPSPPTTTNVTLRASSQRHRAPCAGPGRPSSSRSARSRPAPDRGCRRRAASAAAVGHEPWACPDVRPLRGHDVTEHVLPPRTTSKPSPSGTSTARMPSESTDTENETAPRSRPSMRNAPSRVLTLAGCEMRPAAASTSIPVSRPGRQAVRPPPSLGTAGRRVGTRKRYVVCAVTSVQFR